VSFVKNARVMLVGFALAQAVPLLASPLLTRLFSPAAFGLQTLFVSSTTALAVLATLRIDLATVLAVDRDEAIQIASLAFIPTSAVVVASLLVAVIFGPSLAAATGHAGYTGWIWAVAPMIMVLAVVQIATGFLTWLRYFGPASGAQVVNQFGYLAAAVGLGVWNSPVEGLVAAKLIGQIAAAATLIFVLRRFIGELQLPPRAEWHRFWVRCRPFLVFNTPYSLFGALGREVPVFAFSAVGAMATAGYYGLARTLLGAPATLLSASLSQVFYREAAEHRGSARLEQLTFGLLRMTLTATAPGVALIMVWGDIGFTLAFGPEWVTAGNYAMVLALPAWLRIQTAWPERLYESVAKQGVSFAIQITFDTITALVVFGAVLSDLSPLLAVIMFAAINLVYQLVYLTGMMHVAGFPLTQLLRALGKGAAVLVASAVVLMAFRLSGLPELVGFLCATITALIAIAVVAGGGYRSFRNTAVQVQ
jgi:O-antigen/teichoic acid export membrane protein